MTTDTIDRIDLLYDPVVLEQARERHGEESAIKSNVETTAKTYEIRTALRYWFGGQDTHRTNTAVWRRLRLHDEEGIPPEDAERI